jgi:hypothetical protein
MNRAAGRLLRCRRFPPNRFFSPERSWPATQPWSGYRSFRARHLHSIIASRASGSTKDAEKIDEEELARLMEQFEGSDSKGKVISEVLDNATPTGPSQPPRIKRKSKIEDYDAWHGWDGESDKGSQRNAPSGVNEVDRYISDVLNDVAKSKAARTRAAEEVVEGDRDVSNLKNVSPDADIQEDGIRDISFDGKITGTLGIPESISSRNLPLGEKTSKSTTTDETKTTQQISKTPAFSKADMAALAKKFQNRLDQEIRRLKTQKEVVKQLLSTRARELGQGAQVHFGLLGGKVNEVTGYNEIERLKQDVRERG